MYDWQVEFYKIVGMVSNNHHIKHNKNGHFLVSPAPKQVTSWQNVVDANRLFWKYSAEIRKYFINSKIRWLFCLVW